MSASRYFWLQPAAEFRWLWKPLAEHLSKRLNAKPVFLVPSEGDLKFYAEQFGRPFDGEIVVKPDIYSMAVSGSWPFGEAEARQVLSQFEREYDLVFNRDMLLPDRQLGRAYLTGADGLPRSRTSDAATPRAIVSAGAVTARFFEDLMQRFPPCMVICMSGGTGVQGKPLAAIARRKQIPFRNMMHTRFGFRYYWAEDEFGNAAWLDALLRAEPGPDAAAVEQVEADIRPTGDFEYYVGLKRKRAQFLPMLRFLASTAVKHARYHLGRSRKAKVGYSMVGEMAMIIRGLRHRRFMISPKRQRVADLPQDRRLVFFPLQVEPEISLHGLAPAFIDQLHTVSHISQALPADSLLVVKEHPAQIGRRTDDYYRRLLRFPNVVLLNELDHSYPIIRRAALTVAVTSSAAHEAAVLGRPVAYLCGAGPIHTVAHVTYLAGVADFVRLPELLDTAANGADNQRRIDGARYYLGLRRHAISFDGIGTDLFNRDRNPSEAEIAHVADRLLATLNAGAKPDAPELPVLQEVLG